MEVVTRDIRLFRQQNGSIPFVSWIKALRHIRAKQKVEARIDRMRSGNFGDFASVGEGVFELHIHFGPGYRVYFGWESPSVIVLLIGGDKSSQDEDIKKAKEFWREFKKDEKRR